MYKLYVDGSCKGNGKKNAVGAYAYVLLDENDNKLIEGCSATTDTTNNIMEMRAVIYGIEEALKVREGFHKEEEKIAVYTDSAYIHNCLVQEWYKTWQRNGWKNSSKQPVKNKELWEKIIPFFNNPTISFHKVKGHADNKWNNYVDKMAQRAAKEYIL